MSGARAVFFGHASTVMRGKGVRLSPSLT